MMKKKKRFEEKFGVIRVTYSVDFYRKIIIIDKFILRALGFQHFCFVLPLISNESTSESRIFQNVFFSLLARNDLDRSADERINEKKIKMNYTKCIIGGVRI